MGYNRFFISFFRRWIRRALFVLIFCSFTSINLNEQQLPKNDKTSAFTFAPWQTVLITSAECNAVFGCQQESAFFCKSDLFFLLNPSYLLWTTTAPQLEIPSDPSNSGESKSYEIDRHSLFMYLRLKTTDYRLQTTDSDIWGFELYIWYTNIQMYIAYFGYWTRT